MHLAFIGLGTMGSPMVENLIKAGFQLTVYNRTHSKEEPLAALGAARAQTPGEAARDADVVITMVSDTPDVETVIMGDEGIIHTIKSGSTLIDMSTISPSVTQTIHAALAEKGVGMLDAPVSGGSEGAVNATLAIMVGGEEADLAKVMPVMEALGSSISHVGPSGSGQLTKAMNQIIIAGNYLAVAEGVVFGLKAGLDMEKAIGAIKGGAAASWVLDYRADNMINNTYPLGFRAVLHRKDLGIALQTAKELGVGLPLSALVEQIENGLMSRGFGDEDVSAMARTIRENSGLE